MFTLRELDHNSTLYKDEKVLLYTHMITQFITAFILFIGFDYVWLNYLSNGLYVDGLKPLLRLTADGKIAAVVWAVIVVYIALSLGVVAFVLPKVQALLENKAAFALLWGALMGFVVYAVYDFTNYAIMSQYPLYLALIDVVWGTLLTGVVSLIVVLIF